MKKEEFRIEKDGLGEVCIPKDALYGIHSKRASENFPITHTNLDTDFISAIAQVKKAAAQANRESGNLTPEKADAIILACNAIISGKYHNAFIVDPLQGGAGTSSNMNANEVIANIALLHLGKKPGDYHFIHPIDHVNMHQSTNDVIPTAGRLTVIKKAMHLISSLRTLTASLDQKAAEFDNILCVGRTQLQDAVPMKAGQTFSAFSSMLKRSIAQIERAIDLMRTVNLGGTAIGNGINATKYYFDNVVARLSEVTNEKLYRFANLFDGTQNADDFASVSSAVKICAVKLSKMASDLRLLSSGPNSGMGQVILPARQSGSSIMPAKINPVLPEALNQAAFLTIGHDLTISVAVEAGQLELNAFLPVVFHQLFEELTILDNAVATFTENCIRDIKINEAQCNLDVGRCYSTATALNPVLGYDTSTEIVKKAQKTGKSIVDIACEDYGLTRDRLKELLDPLNLV